MDNNVSLITFGRYTNLLLDNKLSLVLLCDDWCKIVITTIVSRLNIFLKHFPDHSA